MDNSMEENASDDSLGKDREIIESINRLILDDDDVGGDDLEKLKEYKSMVKFSLQRLIVKLEVDADYQHDLEEQISNLEEELENKDICIRRLSQQAKDAIEDCKFQADEMATEMLHKISSEVSQRMDVEKLVRRLEADNSRLQSELELLRVAEVGAKAPSATAQIADMRAELDDLRERYQDMLNECDSLKLQRDGEMYAMTNMVESFEKKIDLMRGKFYTMSQKIQELQRENHTLRSLVQPPAARNSAAHGSVSASVSPPPFTKNHNNKNSSNSSNNKKEEERKPTEESGDRDGIHVTATNEVVTVTNTGGENGVTPTAEPVAGVSATAAPASIIEQQTEISSSASGASNSHIEKKLIPTADTTFYEEQLEGLER